MLDFSTGILLYLSLSRNFLSRSSLLRRMTTRQRAEIQLQSLLNEAEVSLPSFTRRASNRFDTETLSIEEVSKLLNTQPFVIERLINALYPPIGDAEKITSISKLQVRKLTRVLNATIDVRALLFFMMTDPDNDHYVTSNELAYFYQKYLEGLKTFDDHRLQEVIQVILQKFHLDQVITKCIIPL